MDQIKKNKENMQLMPAIDFHCHGIGNQDFSDLDKIDLLEIENTLAKRDHHTILTIYLTKENFNDFLSFTAAFHEGKASGKYPHITGIGLEGPMLNPLGGTPQHAIWVPEKSQWRDIASCAKNDLVYSILSPDIAIPDKEFDWILELLLENGTIPAPGHFLKNDPKKSGQRLQRFFDITANWTGGPIMTDHFINDMPHNFKHAWRSSEEKKCRDAEIKSLNLSRWTHNNMRECLGIIPDIIIKNALQGKVKIAQNFDGEHVDLAIAKKIVELVGSENMILMSDSTERKDVAGMKLHKHEGTNLLYQDKDIVAIGSCNIKKQLNNMRLIGLSCNEINNIIHYVPSSIVHKRNSYVELTCSSI